MKDFGHFRLKRGMAYCISRTGLDWTGLVKRGLVKRGLVKRGLVKRGLVKRGLVKRRLVKRGLVTRIKLNGNFITNFIKNPYFTF